MSFLVGVVFWFVSLFGIAPDNQTFSNQGFFPNGPTAFFNVDSYVTLAGKQQTVDSDPTGKLHTCALYLTLLNYNDDTHGILVERDCNSFDYCRLSYYPIILD